MMAQPATGNRMDAPRAVRIAPGDGNDFAGMLDPLADGVVRDGGPGDLRALRPGAEQVVEGTAVDTLCGLTMMTPNKDIAGRIRAGTPITPTDEDRAMIAGARPC